MKTRRMIAEAAVVVVAVISTQAHALPLEIGDQVEVGNLAGNAFTPTPIAGDSSGLYTNVSFLLNGTTNRSASAGLFVLDYREGASAWEQFESFCLEPDVNLTPFSNPYTVNTLGGAGYLSSPISELWGRYRSQVTNDVNAAAFQVALWELAYGSTDRNLSTGDFRLTGGSGAVFETAQDWLGSLNGAGPSAAGLVVLVNNRQLADRQDLITQVHSVPEPGTLALLGLGLSGIALLQRRRRQPASC